MELMQRTVHIKTHTFPIHRVNYSIVYVHFIETSAHVYAHIDINRIRIITLQFRMFKGSVATFYPERVITNEWYPFSFGVFFVEPPVNVYYLSITYVRQ